MSERERSETVRERAETPHQRYVERTAASRELYERASEVMPGGNSRDVLHYPPYPAYLAEGEGCHVVDEDGTRYLDCFNNASSLVHGHAHPEVVDAVADAVRHSTAPGGPTSLEVEWAEHLCDRVPALELVRFCNSGTEATMNAIRAARAYTGKSVIAKLEGAYHGTHNDVEVSVDPPLHLAGDASDPAAVPDSAGLPASTTDDVCVLPFNDAAAARAKLDRVGADLAGVIVAPHLGSQCIPPADGFLEALREWTAAADIPLIFDEVVSFRHASGGSGAYYGVEPDLVAFGKLVGGGLPVGAFGGREDLLAAFDPRRAEISHSGTFNANPVTAAAGLRTLELYDERSIERLNDLGATLEAGVREVVAEHDIALRIQRIGSLFQLYFSPHELESHRDVAAASSRFDNRLQLALMNEGVRVAEKLSGALSTPMGEAEVETVIEALDAALAEIAEPILAEAPALRID